MNQPLSDTITRLRKERGLTQEQLGQLVGVSAQAVSKWEKGGAPDVELLPVLADRLGVSIDALFGRAEPSTADMTTQFQQWLLSMPIEKRFSALFEMVREINTFLAVPRSKDAISYAIARFDELTNVLGLLYQRREQNLDAEIEALIEKRQQARKNKDFQTADKIRDDLKARGILLEDTPQGVKWSYQK